MTNPLSRLGWGAIALASVIATPYVFASSVWAAGMEAPTNKIEVVIRDTEHGFSFKGWSLPGVPTTIVVRNEDHMTHGFTSRLFNEVQVKMEGQGNEVRGKHLKSFHLEPGKTMTLHFTAPSSKFDPSGAAETMYYAFWCDLHPEARGELYIVETRGEIGGG